MKSGNFWIYLLVMFGVTYLIRVLPFVIFHRKIENKTIRSDRKSTRLNSSH